MHTNHDRLHRDEKELRSLAMTELQTVYADLGLTQEELDLLSAPRRSFFGQENIRAAEACHLDDPVSVTDEPLHEIEVVRTLRIQEPARPFAVTMEAAHE